MINERVQAELDQSRATFCELFPLLWKGLYDGLMREGFTEAQAMVLVEVYILSNGKNGIIINPA